MDTKALQAQARQQRLVKRAAVRETLETQRRAAAEAKLRRQRITVGMVILFCSSSLVLMYVLFFRPVCGKMNVPVRTAQVWMKVRVQSNPELEFCGERH